MSTWDVEVTDEFKDWYRNLTDNQRRAIAAKVDLLEEQGPNLGRPAVAEVDGSSINNLKELRASADQAALRVMFVFDPRRTAILLLGGNKAGAWKAWYREAIPEAERLYAEYLGELRREGLIE